MCRLFLPLVSIFGLFPVLVSCHYELIRVQLCVCDYVLLPCVFSSCLLSLIWSGLLVTSRCILSVSLAMSCLDVFIKVYYLSLRPRLRVLVPPCCVHRDTQLDNTNLDQPITKQCLILFRLWCKKVVLAIKEKKT